MRLIDADDLGIGRARRDAFLIPEYADGWNSAIEHIENAPTVDIKIEVAREIFAEIEDVFLMFKPQYFADAPHLNYKRLTDYFAKLKNKYIGGVGE